MILLDTHALVWLDGGSPRLGQLARKLLDDALTDAALWASAMTFWECALLSRNGRLTLGLPVGEWRQNMLARGLQEIPIDGPTAIRSVELDLPQKDPADRFIVATALAKDALLVTADERILSWPGQLRRHDARL